ncbi:MAG: alpha-amylase family glycosyl hydrolase [Ferruginibacter sp.]
MQKILLSLLCLLCCVTTYSQLLSWSPLFSTENTNTFEITVDATKGNKGLDFYTPTNDVYVHTGVITNLSTSPTDWRYVKFNQNFNQPNALLNATYVGSFPSQKWRFTITGGLRNYYGITDAAETIQKISILFRNGVGNKVQRNIDGSDMYIPVYNNDLNVRFTSPFLQPTFNTIPEPITKTVGETILVTAEANSSPFSTIMRLYFNGNLIQTVNGDITISATPTIAAAGLQTFIVEATDGINTKSDSLKFFVAGATQIESLPVGVRDGINYSADNTSATLVMYAPFKTRATVIGDLPNSNWEEQTQYQMKKTPDDNYFWLTITGLTPGTEYAFQYLVDGNLRIGEAYTEKVLDPWNDQFITPSTYPNLKPYPVGKTSGIVSVLQTAAPTYTWQTTNYTRPDKRNLIIYELLLRDYLAAPNWKTLTDTLNYIKKLGINTIQLLPFNEFEGNISWGYNPSYYFAPDKYYGPKNELKAFIDSCHKRGIAVVLDIALNHSFGQSPMVQLYFDNINNRPTSENPWFNPFQKHGFNVGYDMNHESLATRYFTSRVVTHWLQEYKLDGFRFDLSKGFTQTQTCDGNGNNCNINNWGNYDASRIAIWKRYYDTLQLKSPGSFTILEHFAQNDEEVELANYGMMLWGNMHYNFSEAAQGWINNSNFNGALHISRGWLQPHLISYLESHDEERLMVNIRNTGRQEPGYDTRNFETALDRAALSAAFLLTMPGPKMIWQFGELGYDYSINYCQNGSNNSACRTDPKPITWDYLQVNGRKDLYNVYKAVLQLRNDPLYAEAFTTGSINRDFSGAFKWMTLNSGASKLVIIGNFDVTSTGGNVTFPTAGIWYEYLNAPATFNANGGSQFFFLNPGEFKIFTSSNVVLPVTLVNFYGKNNRSENLLNWEVKNEVDLNHYELERSFDGTIFNYVGRINATGSSNYSYTDKDISKSPVYFYRLKKVDIDGRFSYSGIIRLNGNIKSLTLVAIPNPFKEILKISVSSAIKINAHISITDLSGRVLYQQPLQVQPGVNVYEIAEASKFATGTYQLHLQSREQKTTLRVLKVN